MTLREHLEAIVSTWDDPDLDFPRALAEARGHAVAALKALDEATEPGRWWANGQGVMSADYRCRIVPDPAPGDPDPWAFADPAPPTENTQPTRSNPAATTTTKRGTTAQPAREGSA